MYNMLGTSLHCVTVFVSVIDNMTYSYKHVSPSPRKDLAGAAPNREIRDWPRLQLRQGLWQHQGNWLPKEWTAVMIRMNKTWSKHSKKTPIFGMRQNHGPRPTTMNQVSAKVWSLSYYVTCGAPAATSGAGSTATFSGIGDTFPSGSLTSRFGFSLLSLFSFIFRRRSFGEPCEELLLLRLRLRPGSEMPLKTANGCFSGCDAPQLLRQRLLRRVVLRSTSVESDKMI